MAAAMVARLCLLLMLYWSSSEATPSPADVNSTSADVSGQTRVKRFAISTAAIGNIIAGASLFGVTANSLLQGLRGSYTVANVIEIENHTKWRLSKGQSWTKWGYVANSPHTVDSGEKEAWQTHKTSGTVVGSAGIIVYHVDGLDEVLAIVWHAPYNFNHLSNYLAIGLYSKKHWDGDFTFNDAYNEMRNGSPDDTTWVSSPTWPWCDGLYYHSTPVCRTYSPYIVVDGSMGSAHHTTTTIRVYARNPSNKAPE